MVGAFLHFCQKVWKSAVHASRAGGVVEERALRALDE